MDKTINERLFEQLMRAPHAIRKAAIESNFEDMPEGPHGHGPMHGRGHGGCHRHEHEHGPEDCHRHDEGEGHGCHRHEEGHGPMHGLGHGSGHCRRQNQAFGRERVLEVISRYEDGVRQKTLTEELRINPSSVSEMISKLENDGYVKRAVDPATGSDYAYLFSVFDGYGDGTNPDINVQATDDTTITFKLTAPCPYMMGLLAFPVFMPVPDAAFGSDSWANEAGFVSDGPYTLKSWTHNESMVYVKNPNYYDAANVSVDELDFMLSADDTAILAAYQSGDIDYADTVPTGEIQNLKDGDDFHVIPNLGTYYVGFNVNSSMFEGKTVAQAAAMRRALGLLIDRQYIVDTIGQTEQKVATSFIPYSMSNGNGGEFKTTDDYAFPVDDGYYQDYSVAPDQNTAEAIKLLEYAGYQFDDNNMLSADTPITINYLTNEGTGHEGVAQAIQQDLSAIGIQMNISVEDWQTFLNDRKQGNFDVAREGWLADYDDPINMLEMFQSSSGNNDMQLGK